MRAGQAGDLRSDANPEALLLPSSPFAQRDIGGSRLARNHLRVEMDELAVPLEDAPIDHDKIHVGWLGGADDEMRRIGEHGEVYIAGRDHNEIGALARRERAAATEGKSVGVRHNGC